MQQQILFNPEELFKEPLKKYETLFSLLDLSSLEESLPSTGRKPISRAALTRALIFKNLRSLPTLSDLVAELYERPSLSFILGFQPRIKTIPVERFSSFLRDTDNLLFQKVRESLVKMLMQLKIIKGKYLSLDACPIKANVKQNNLKTSIKNRFCKENQPKHDPDCRLGVFATFPSGEKKVEFFWGYRNHIINDAQSELPLVEITLPANVRGTSVVLPHFALIKEELALKPKAVLGDSEYDSAAVIEYIVKELKAKPRIARNPRGGTSPTLKFSSSGIPICIAGFQMVSRGIYWDKKENRRRHKFVCPIRGSKRFAQQHPYCPWFHPQFVKGSGCYKNIRVDVDETIRQKIDYGSENFKKDYNLRTSSERLFSRLLALLMQEPTVKGLRATANLCTIAHITVLAVAYLASFVKEPKRIRFVKSFIPNL
jgi:hypothetical protein